MHLNSKAKLAVLTDAAKYDASCASSGSTLKRGGKGVGSTEGMGICHSYTPDGRCVSLLKILLTNYCIYDCKYCINRISSNIQRTRFTAREVVYLTLEFYKRNYIEGLFLSSGILRDADYTMEQMVLIAKTLRLTHGYNGYIHLKGIPGASNELITQAGFYADRLSVNIELPTDADLQALAPDKKRPLLESNMAHINQKIAENTVAQRSKNKLPVFSPAGQSTQMIIGATPSNDRKILNTASHLYKHFKLRRVYYSAFNPIPDAHSSLPVAQPPLLREHRLYQADWMLRFYGFDVSDIVPVAAPQLPLDMDPKTAWALRNRAFFPIDINKASREALLRVPGIGTSSVQKILAVRRHCPLKLNDLRKMRCVLKRAQPFIITRDYHPHGLLDRANLSSLVNSVGEQLALPL
jgi:putative DNA modification/repair radical SAM protein